VVGLTFLLVEVCCQVLRDEPVEQHAEHVALEVPPVNAAAQIVGDAPDGFVKFGSLRFLRNWGHAHATAFVVNVVPRSSSQLFHSELDMSDFFSTTYPP